MDFSSRIGGGGSGVIRNTDRGGVSFEIRNVLFDRGNIRGPVALFIPRSWLGGLGGDYIKIRKLR